MYDKVMVVPTDIQNDNPTDYFKKSISTDNFETLGYVRKYMNGAIYIESTIDITAEFEPEPVPSKHDDIPIKRISCSCTSIRSCKIHENLIVNQISATEIVKKEITPKARNFKTPSDDKLKRTISSATTTVTLPDDSELQKDGITNKEIKPKARSVKTASNDKLKSSISSATTAITLPDETELEKDEIYQKWMVKKNEEKKRIEENKIYLQAKEEEQKQKRLEQERGNFKRWLSYKKKEEEKRRLEKEKKQKEDKDKEAQKELRNSECKLRYQLWLKRKEQEELEKKLKEQMKIIKITDAKQKRIEENEMAFKSWLSTSKDKPKPIAPSQGLASMLSSASVTYINPVPWSPNIQNNEKPVSQ